MASDLREINLEDGKPLVDQAMARLALEINRSRSMKMAAMKVIHGYGSSGTGGRIRVETRAYLTRMKNRKEIKDWFGGEDFSLFRPATLAAFRACHALRDDRDCDRHNNGVSFIIL